MISALVLCLAWVLCFAFCKADTTENYDVEKIEVTDTIITKTTKEITKKTTPYVTTEITTTFPTTASTLNTVTLLEEFNITCLPNVESNIEATECVISDIEINEIIEEEVIEKVVEEIEEVVVSDTNSDLIFTKHFSRGTFYSGGYGVVGGSGRELIDCSYGDGTVKGSIASRYLYDMYGYYNNDGRTMVYLEIEGYSDMNGYYYLDDASADNVNNAYEVIDFYYLYNSNCQFQYQGVVQVDCYICN